MLASHRLTAVLLIVMSWVSLAAAAPPLPKLYILYPGPGGTVFDRNCPDLMHTQINPRDVRQTARRLPEFQAWWDAEGPALLSAAYAEVGLEFPYREMQAALTVCPMPSMSVPLIINVRSFLSGRERPAQAMRFAELVFHELMHTYTMEVRAASELRKKYDSESVVTLNHLHVMALEKLVLLKLGKSGELEELDRSYRTRAPAEFKRAWEIVNDDESCEAFIGELKQLRK